MSSFKWQRNKNRDLVAYASNGKIRICLRVKPNGEYEGLLLNNNLPHLNAMSSKPVHIFGDRSASISKAMIDAENAYFTYMQISKRKSAPATILVKETENGYELLSTVDVDEIRYIKEGNKRSKVYTSPIPFGYNYTATSYRDGKAVVSVTFGKKDSN